jgi:hypothetical protein
MASRFRGDCRQGATPPFFSPTDADVHLGRTRDKTGHALKRPRSRTVAS